MPLADILSVADDARIGFWWIEQGEFSHLKLDLARQEGISHPVKQQEWCASRVLLEVLVKESGFPYRGIVKNKQGKPFDPEQRFHLSLSHAYPLVGAIISDIPVGVDVDLSSEKIRRVAPRFCSENELSWATADLDWLTGIWCGKEAVYKAMGRQGLSFRDHIHIDPLMAIPGTSRATVKGRSEPINLHFLHYLQHVVCYTSADQMSLPSS